MVGSLEAPLKPRATNYPPNQIILGRVMDAEKKEPVPNAVVSVEMTQQGDRGLGSPPEGTDPLSITDEQGNFSINSATPFDHMNLKVEARGFARRNFNEIKPGPKQHNFTVSEGVSVTGRVLKEGKPTKEITMGIVSADRGIGQFTGEFVTGTREDGKFLFLNLPPDISYYLYGEISSFQGIGALPAKLINARADGSTLDVGELSVQPGRRLAGQVKLSDGASLPANTRLLIGRREAWDSFPVELPPDGKFDIRDLPPESLELSCRIKGYTVSDQNASMDQLNPFRLVGRLDQDKTNLVFLLEPGETDYRSRSRSPDADRPENLPLAGVEEKRRLPAGRVLTGNVTDAETGQPIPSFRILPGERMSKTHHFAQWMDRRAVSGSNGWFTLEIPKPKGFTVLQIEAEGYLPMQSDALEPSQTNLTFALKRGSGPQGVLLDISGKPAADVRVFHLGAQEQCGLSKSGEIKGNSMSRLAVTNTDAAGRFKFAPKLGQGLLLASTADGFARAWADELQKSGELRLERWSSVRGTLVGSNGPAADTHVDLKVTHEFTAERPYVNMHGVKTDPKGLFIISNVPPGELRLTTRDYVGNSRNSGWQSIMVKEFKTEPGQELDLGELKEPGKKGTEGFIQKAGKP